MKALLFISLLFALAAGSLVAQSLELLGGPDVDIPIANGDLNPRWADRTDFGTSPNASRSRVFRLRNTSNSSIAVSASSDSSVFQVCTVDLFGATQFTIPPKDSIDLRIVFDPNGEGDQFAIVTFTTNEAAPNIFTFRLKGTGAPPIPETHGDLTWHVSVKIFTMFGGVRPCGELSSNRQIYEKYRLGNLALQRFGRGYKLEVTEIIEIPDPFGDFIWRPIGNPTRELVENAARADKAFFKWRDNAINVYILGAMGSGYCSRPFDGTTEAIIIGQQLSSNRTPLHECGHLLGLCHTHGCAVPAEGCANPESDLIADTIWDCNEWDRDGIANYSGNFGMDYSLLTPPQQDRVDDVWFNLMSYHDVIDFPDNERLTPDQLDVMAHTSNRFYSAAATGRTYFVGGGVITDSLGNSTTPAASTSSALQSAGQTAGKHILMFRPGTHTHAQRINQRVVLRASRGSAFLRHP